MPIAGITGQGLTAIAFLVAFLWSCLVMEKSIIRRANEQNYKALHELRVMRLRRHAVPAAAPAPARNPVVRQQVG